MQSAQPEQNVAVCGGHPCSSNPPKPPNCAAKLENLSWGIVENGRLVQPRPRMPSLPTPLPVDWPIGSHPHCVPRRMQSFSTGGLAGWCWWPSH